MKTPSLSGPYREPTLTQLSVEVRSGLHLVLTHRYVLKLVLINVQVHKKHLLTDQYNLFKVYNLLKDHLNLLFDD